MAQITDDKIEKLIPRIYAAAVHPEGWNQTLGAICEELGVTGASMTNTSMLRDLAYWSVAGVDERLLESGEENPGEFLECNKAILANRWYEGHVTTLEHWLGRSFVQRTSYFQEVLRPHGVRDVAAIFFALDQSVPAGLEFAQLFRTSKDRPFVQAELDAMQRLAPHLRTAAELARRVYAVKGIYENLMDQAARPMILVGLEGKVLRANSAALRILERGSALRLERGRVVSLLPQVTAELHLKIGHAVNAPTTAVEQAGGLVMALPNPDGVRPLMASITPLHTAHPLLRDVAVSAAALWLDDPCADVDPSEEALRVWFGLTPAEARVAIDLTNGLSPKEIAANTGRHIRTVRTQVEAVFNKVGVNRVAQLVRVIARVADLAPARDL